MASLQTTISSKLSFSDTQPISYCHHIWDTETARFTPCALPYVSTIPAIFGALVLLRYSLRVTSAYWPRWMKPFVQETKDKIDEFEVAPTQRPWTATIGLLVIASIGLTFQITHVFLPLHQPMAIYPAIAWAVVIGILLVERPRTASLSLLILFTGLMLEQLIMLSHKQTPFVASDLPWVVAPIASFLAIITVLNMPLRDPMMPSKDISAVYDTPTSQLRTPEDNLTPWQYMTVSWMEPLIKIGNSRQMEDSDTWDLGWEFKHARLHDAFRTLRGSVTRKVFVANGMDLLRITFFDLVHLCATLLTPVFLQRVLASMELHNNRATITYACIILVLRLISAQLNVFTLWYQRRAYERCRGELITMLYEKTLHRKIVGANQDEKMEHNADDSVDEAHDEADEEASAGDGSSQPPARNWIQTLLAAIRPSPKKNIKTATKEKNDAASMGKILNLMRSDAYEIAQRFWEFSDIFTKPVGIIFAIILIWRMLGWACLLGVLALAVSQLANIIIARVQIYFEKKRRLATDEKIQRTSQFIESIRHLRWYGWQDTWLERILESREKELHLRVVNMFFMTSMGFIIKFGSGLFPAVAFYAFTKTVGQDLRIDLIFPALDLFNQLESNLRYLPQLITTLLNAYVAMGRIEEFMAEPDKEDTGLIPEGSAELSLNQASFAWPGANRNVLSEITLAFPPGLTVVYGEVAAGKTALLQALLGELDTTAGELVRPDQMVAYCAQTPWLQSMSIRDNILFSSPYDAVRYKQTLEACALLPDMVELKHGDLSNIGENGIGLSGGQKARVALARAVYSNAKVLLLDDPLSALDHQTAEFIVAKLFAGPLLQGRTTVLVTHRTELCHGIAKQWVQLEHGLATIHEPTQDEDADALKRTHTNEAESEEEKKKREEEHSAAVPDKFIEDEHRAKGGVKWSVYWRYVKAGTLRWWSLAIFAMAAFRVIDFAQVWFMKSWGESYDDAEHHGLFDFLPPATENVDPWLWTFFLLIFGSAAALWWTGLTMYSVGYHAAKTIFRETVQRVAHATFRFYDVTPVGRLMNRLTSDMNTIDGDLSRVLISFAWQAIGWISCIVIILSSTPAFLAFGLLLCCGFVYYFFRFLPTSQSLRRLEMVSLSPLMSNFGALVEGLTTVRAFKAQHRFQARVIEVVDNFQKNDHFYWSLQAWLALRFSLMSASSTLIMTLIAVYTGISPGLTAFVLITAGKFVLHTEMMCRYYGNLEMDFTSVERVVELLDVETEAPGVVEPPAYWPTYNGDIEFDDVTIRYAENLDPALRNITLKIPAGSNTAVIGRTGSGKSTLALSLLATIAAENGRILIDGIDISTVKKQALRSRITFLAQEPVLFPGTMRKNLDPLSEYSDASCLSVLEKIGGNHYSWSLTTNIEGGGKGLSQGQRQLVGLARAMLRRSPILIMDEATASIDFETAQRIQSVLREEMKSSTVITIAHRLEAVKAADYCVVLGNGKLVKAGRADDMLREGSEFQAMLA